MVWLSAGLRHTALKCWFSTQIDRIAQAGERGEEREAIRAKESKGVRDGVLDWALKRKLSNRGLSGVKKSPKLKVKHSREYSRLTKSERVVWDSLSCVQMYTSQSEAGYLQSVLDFMKCWTFADASETAAQTLSLTTTATPRGVSVNVTWTEPVQMQLTPQCTLDPVVFIPLKNKQTGADKPDKVRILGITVACWVLTQRHRG